MSMDFATAPFVTSDMISRTIKATNGRKHLYHFFKDAWNVIEPGTPLIWNWHIGAICEHLQAVTRREIQRLIISIPPGFAKSISAAVMWQPWEWLEIPHERSLFGSYDGDLVLRDANRSKDIIESDWYQNTFTPEWQIKPNQNAASFFVNTATGNRRGFFMGSKSKIGWRGDKIVLDDPISGDDRYNIPVKDKAWEVYTRGLQTRVNDPRKAAFVVMAQRLAVDDIQGRLLELPDNGGYVHLCFPARFDPDRKCKTSVRFDKASLWPPKPHTDGSLVSHLLEEDEENPVIETFEDPRSEKNELLFPEQFPEEQLTRFELLMGPEDYNAQFEQNPIGGKNIRFDEKDFRYWQDALDVVGDHRVIALPRPGGNLEYVSLSHCWTFCSLDPAVSEEERSCYSVILEWAVTPKMDMVLMNMFRDRITEPKLLDVIFDMHSIKNHAGSRHKMWICEKNGIGKPLLQNMERKMIPVVPVVAHEDKYSRSLTAAVKVKSGSVFFPPKNTTPWMAEFIKELVNFPLYSTNDIVDAFSIGAQGLFEGWMASILSSDTPKDTVTTIKPNHAKTIEDRIRKARANAGVLPFGLSSDHQGAEHVKKVATV